METAALAALIASTGFATGDVLTAIGARNITGRASAFLITLIKLGFYIPFIILWRQEFQVFDVGLILCILLLGSTFTAAYLSFNKALEVGTAAVVGLIAGAFPALATLVSVLFLGERPTLIKLILLATVLIGVYLVSAPQKLRTKLRLDQGNKLALATLLLWGFSFGIIRKPSEMVGTEHGWFVVWSLITLLMVLLFLLIFRRNTVEFVSRLRNFSLSKIIIAAAIIIGIGEAAQAYALGRGQTSAVAGILGGYPAVYVLIANRVFKESLGKRQWVGIVVVAISIILLSAGL